MFAVKNKFNPDKIIKYIQKKAAKSYRRRIFNFAYEVIYTSPVLTGLLVNNWNITTSLYGGITYTSSPLLREGENVKQRVERGNAINAARDKIDVNTPDFDLEMVGFSNRTPYAKIVDDDQGIFTRIVNTWESDGGSFKTSSYR